jgi:hypothetical protein
MITKKPTDLKSVSLEQVKDLDGKTVVGGGDAPTQSASTEGKGDRDIRKMEKTLDKLEKNPTPHGGSSSGGDSKSMDKDQAKRTEDGRDDGPTGLPGGLHPH